MKPKLNRFLAASAVSVLALSSTAFAVDRIKADNTNNLNLGTSWGGTAPGTGDVGVWDNTVTTANTVNLGGNLIWGGLRIADPGGDVTIGGGNTLTLGASGLDTGSTRNLTINATGKLTISGPLAGSTTLTLNSSAEKHWESMAASSFTGTLVLRGGTGASGAHSGNWLAFGAASFTQTGAFALDTGASLTNRGEFIVTDAFGDGTTKAKLNLTSLQGYGDFRSDWGADIATSGNRTISVNQAADTELQGRIIQKNATGRSIHLEKLGVGTLTLSGENSYQNTIVGGSGKLQIGNGGATGNIGSGTVSVGTGSTLEFNRTGTLDYKTSARMRNVSGAGDIVVNGGVKIFNYTGSGAGFAEANSWNNFSGDLIIKGGSEFQTIRNGATAMGTGSVILGDATTSGKLSQIEGNWTWTNNISLVGSANEILNNATGGPRYNKLQGVISGAGGLTLSDPAAGMTDGNTGFILTGTNTMNGTLTVDTFVRVGGVTGDDTSLDGGTGGTLGTADVVINSGKRLTFSRSDAHAVANAISGAGDVYIGSTGITGTGTQVVTFTNTKSYTGETHVNKGTLVLSGDNSAATGAVFVTGMLAGSGGIVGGNTTINAGGHLAPGDGSAHSTGTVTLNGTLAFAATSIFDWDINSPSGVDLGLGTENGGSYDQVVNNNAAKMSGESVFNIILGTGKSFDDNFWDTDKSWTDVFSGTGLASDLSSIFSSFTLNGTALTDGLVAGQGQFTFNNSSTLQWSAVPEPTTALAGLLLVAGLFRRKRAA